MRGPDCDWCGADEDDMDVYSVGDDFVCEDCYLKLETGHLEEKDCN